MNAQRAGLAATAAVIAASMVSVIVGVSQATTHPVRHGLRPASACHHRLANSATQHPGRRCSAA